MLVHMQSAPHLLHRFASPREPQPDLPRTPSAHVVLVAFSSLAAHVVLATSLGHGQASHAKVTPRPPTRIDIQVRRAAPPPPPVAVTPAPPPPARPEPRRPARPRATAPAPEPAPREEVAPAPVSTEGTLAPEPQTLAPAPVIAASSVPSVEAPAPAVPRREEAREGANYRHNPRPAYPRVAQREGWEGTVTLRVQVLPNGRPATIRVARSSGRDVLDEAAVETVRGWSFAPATLDGEPTTGWVSVPIAFRLSR